MVEETLGVLNVGLPGDVPPKLVGEAIRDGSVNCDIRSAVPCLLHPEWALAGLPRMPREVVDECCRLIQVHDVRIVFQVLDELADELLALLEHVRDADVARVRERSAQCAAPDVARLLVEL